jgi:hypothetical protein
MDFRHSTRRSRPRNCLREDERRATSMLQRAIRELKTLAYFLKSETVIYRTYTLSPRNCAKVTVDGQTTLIFTVRTTEDGLDLPSTVTDSSGGIECRMVLYAWRLWDLASTLVAASQLGNKKFKTCRTFKIVYRHHSQLSKVRRTSY